MRYLFIFGLFGLFGDIVYSQSRKIPSRALLIEVEQLGRVIRVVRNTITLERAPFRIIFKSEDPTFSFYARFYYNYPYEVRSYNKRYYAQYSTKKRQKPQKYQENNITLEDSRILENLLKGDFFYFSQSNIYKPIHFDYVYYGEYKPREYNPEELTEKGHFYDEELNDLYYTSKNVLTIDKQKVETFKNNHFYIQVEVDRSYVASIYRTNSSLDSLSEVQLMGTLDVLSKRVERAMEAKTYIFRLKSLK